MNREVDPRDAPARVHRRRFISSVTLTAAFATTVATTGAAVKDAASLPINARVGVRAGGERIGAERQAVEHGGRVALRGDVELPCGGCRAGDLYDDARRSRRTSRTSAVALPTSSPSEPPVARGPRPGSPAAPLSMGPWTRRAWREALPVAVPSARGGRGAVSGGGRGDEAKGVSHARKLRPRPRAPLMRS